MNKFLIWTLILLGLLIPVTFLTNLPVVSAYCLGCPASYMGTGDGCDSQTNCANCPRTSGACDCATECASGYICSGGYCTSAASCTSGWKCPSSSYRDYQYSDCSWYGGGTYEYCTYGCIGNGVCDDAPAPSVPSCWTCSDSYYDSWCNDNYCDDGCGENINYGDCYCGNDCRQDGESCSDNNGCVGSSTCCTEGPDAGTCQSSCAPACTQNSYVACSDNDLYNYNSCDVRGIKEEECNHGSDWYDLYRCSPTNSDQPQRRYWTRGCSGSSCYTNTDNWQDFGNACAGNQECSGGSCIDSCDSSCDDKSCGQLNGCGDACGSSTDIGCSCDDDNSCTSGDEWKYSFQQGKYCAGTAKADLATCEGTGKCCSGSCDTSRTNPNGYDSGCRTEGCVGSSWQYKSSNDGNSCGTNNKHCEGGSCNACPTSVCGGYYGDYSGYTGWRFYGSGTSYPLGGCTYAFASNCNPGPFWKTPAKYNCNAAGDVEREAATKSCASGSCATSAPYWSFWKDCTSTEKCNAATGTCDSCSGTPTVTFTENPTTPEAAINPIASGLSNCAGKTIQFREGSCSGTLKSSCVIGAGGAGCTGDTEFAVPQNYGTFTYYACII